MLRANVVLLIFSLCSCSSSEDNNRAYYPKVSPDNSMQILDLVRQDKRCGLRTLGFWPPRPIEHGIVSNPSRAKSLAYIYLVSIYGENVIRLPLSAEIKNGLWLVEDAGPGEGAIGGARYVEICQSNGAVISTFETQ